MYLAEMEMKRQNVSMLRNFLFDLNKGFLQKCVLFVLFVFVFCSFCLHFDCFVVQCTQLWVNRKHPLGSELENSVAGQRSSIPQKGQITHQ